MSLQGTLQNTGFYNNKSMKDKIGISSLKIMDGEDISNFKELWKFFKFLPASGDRKYLQSLQQKEWITQQINEKNDKKNAEKQEKLFIFFLF